MSTLPREWVDKDTGYRVVRLSNKPGSSSLYFNFNGYTPQGDYLIISTPDGLEKVNMETFEVSEILNLDDRPFKFLFVGMKYRRAYFQTLDDNTVSYVDIDTKQIISVAQVNRGDIQTINCDETLLGGVETDPNNQSEALKVFENRDKKTDQFDYRAEWPDGTPMSYADAKELRMNQRLNAGVDMKMFVIDTKNGERRDIYGSKDWLNHLLFSPTDPNLLMYCHEGNWHCVDRLWLLDISTATPKPTKIHHRTMNMEIAGHEWWSHDGKTIWYDLQMPRGGAFYVSGYEVATGKRTWYHVEDRNHWSVHYHSSPIPNPDKSGPSLFCGDGGDEEMVAHAKDAKWLYLFTPQSVPDVAGLTAPNSDGLIRPGYMKTERLVNMDKQDYRLEPNAHFSPDGKWVVFRGNMSGEIHTYAVELKGRG